MLEEKEIRGELRNEKRKKGKTMEIQTEHDKTR